jgi:hypothetical protein
VNQIVVIFVPYGENFAGSGVRQDQRPEPKDDHVQNSASATSESIEDADQLPLRRWFTFEKGP